MEMLGVVSILPIGRSDWQLTESADFSHDHARSRAFRWGEDGIAGVSDTHGQQCIAFAFWNEKECVFGVYRLLRLMLTLT